MLNPIFLLTIPVVRYTFFPIQKPVPLKVPVYKPYPKKSRLESI
jgi:hypothetical protein